MKNLLTFVFALSAIGVYAQNMQVNVNGLRICKDCSKEDMLAAFGKNPTRVVESKEFPNFFTYYYDKDSFEWFDGYFGACDIYSNRYAVNNLVRVGDDINAIDKLGGIKKISQSYYRNGTKIPACIQWYATEKDKKDYTSVEFCYDEQSEKIISIHIYYNFM